LGLEQQFANFDLHSDQLQNSDQPSLGKNLDAEGDDADEEPVKLFVGQVSNKSLSSSRFHTQWFSTARSVAFH
jgi:hypothetical protein